MAAGASPNFHVSGAGHKTKVAVLGGGVGGMTAAFELTATPELRERFEVTLYQLGWRVGGKGASGRNPGRSERIEEHGLHVWFGFYDNAFRLMRDAYEELGRGPGTPLATIDDAFKPCDRLVLYDRQGDGWHAHTLDFPRNLLRPGEPGELPTFWEMAERGCHWALSAWRALSGDRDLDLAEPDLPFVPDWFEDLASELAGDVLDLPLEGAERLLVLAERLAGARAGHTDHLVARQAAQPALLVRLLKGFRDWLWLVLREPMKDDAELRFFFTFVDAGVSTVAGIVEDGVLERGFDAVNDEEWSAWLARHGAKEVTLGHTPELRAPVLRAVYDVAFGFPGGSIAAADVAAGTATSDLLRLVFSYRGSFMRKMQAGMGDTVFTPFYEVLRRRGVRFKFFHEVTKLSGAGDARRVDSIEVVRQVELRDGAEEYLPLADVRGLPCWPSEPLWDQLEPAARGHDFELQPNPLGRDPLLLRRGEDFDAVVLGIPVGALEPICRELMDRDERFRRGIERAVTVQTQAFQVWADRRSAELGWKHEGNSVAGCYVEPIDTYCDMTHLISREDWKRSDGVRTIAYLCGVLEERRGETQDQATERVHRNAVEFLERDMPILWPDACRSDGSFDWDVLVDPEGRAGRERFQAQYWRANVAPSERYVLTPAGSVEHRLPSDDSGFENLTLAGDWTRNGIDGGCVEAAVISGIEAAAALTGEKPTIPGRADGWLRPRPLERPQYVEFGGRATAPPPFQCQGGRLRSLLLRGDEESIAQLVERMFNAPAGDAVEYRPLGSPVVLLVGEFGRVASLTPPYDRWGAVRETQASFWFPVLAGRKRGGVFRPERLVLAVPYIFVDNPMSYLGGREAYGYAKTMGKFTPEDGLGATVRIDAFGGNFGRNEGAGWYPFIEIAEGAPAPPARSAPADGPEALVTQLTGGLTSLSRALEFMVDDGSLAAGLVADMVAGRVGQVFLKQFRDAPDGSRACYQSVVEAPVTLQRVRTRPTQRQLELVVHRLDSHPIGQELGIASQRAELAFEVELDMVVEDGREVARSTIAAPASGAGEPVGPRPETDGQGSFVEYALRWGLRELGEPVLRSLGRFWRR
jgi:uncharacterized protein with NAD-binding domain and iron-sulfur cluster